MSQVAAQGAVVQHARVSTAAEAAAGVASRTVSLNITDCTVGGERAVVQRAGVRSAAKPGGVTV